MSTFQEPESSPLRCVKDTLDLVTATVRSCGSHAASYTNLRDHSSMFLACHEALQEEQELESGWSGAEVARPAASQEVQVRRRETLLHTSSEFQIVVITAIALNAVMVAVKASFIHSHAVVHWISVLENCFTIFFTVELGIRIHEHRTFFEFFWGHRYAFWNIFDFLITIVGLIELCLQVTFGGHTNLKTALVIRIFRIVRMMRLLRALRFLSEVDFVMRTAMQTMFYYAVLLFFAQFVFGVLATNLLWDMHDENYSQMFSSLGVSMWTLFCLMTLDGWIAVVNGIIEERPLMQPFFILFIFFSVSAVSIIPTIFIEVHMSEREARAKAKAQMEQDQLIPRPKMPAKMDADAIRRTSSTRSNSVPLRTRRLSIPQVTLPLFTSDEEAFPAMRSRRSSKISRVEKQIINLDSNVDNLDSKELALLRSDIEATKQVLLEAFAEQSRKMAMQIQALTIHVLKSQRTPSKEADEQDTAVAMGFELQNPVEKSAGLADVLTGTCSDFDLNEPFQPKVTLSPKRHKRRSSGIVRTQPTELPSPALSPLNSEKVSEAAAVEHGSAASEVPDSANKKKLQIDTAVISKFPRDICASPLMSAYQLPQSSDEENDEQKLPENGEVTPKPFARVSKERRISYSPRDNAGPDVVVQRGRPSSTFQRAASADERCLALPHPRAGQRSLSESHLDCTESHVIFKRTRASSQDSPAKVCGLGTHSRGIDLRM